MLGDTSIMATSSVRVQSICMVIQQDKKAANLPMGGAGIVPGTPKISEFGTIVDCEDGLSYEAYLVISVSIQAGRGRDENPPSPSPSPLTSS